MKDTNRIEMNPVYLHRSGRGPLLRFSAAGVCLIPVGVLSVCCAIALVLWQLGMLPVSRQNADPSFLVLWGAALLAVLGIGLILLFEEYLRWLLKRRRAVDPGSPWLLDYNWNPWGTRISGWGEFATALYVLVFLAMLIPLLLILGTRDAEFYYFVLVLGLLAVVMLITLVKELFRHFKYGATWVRYQRFPFHPGEKVVLAWGAQRGFNPLNRLIFTLRYVVEKKVISRSHRRMSIDYYPHQMWAITGVVEGTGKFAPGQEQVVTFTIPANVPTTNFRNDPPSYWELEVVVDAPGIDMRRVYPVPIYERPEIGSGSVGLRPC